MHLRSRGYLPHLETPSGVYFVTCRLIDSVPQSMLQRLRLDSNLHKITINQGISEPLSYLQARRFERIMDSSLGNCWLRNPPVAYMVASALRHFDRQRYVLYAWTVMPNHVHLLLRPCEPHSLSSVLHGWKSFTAHSANKLLNRSGSFWQKEYFDKLVRSERQLDFFVRYILNNPVKAGLCKRPLDWRWSGYSPEVDAVVRRLTWKEEW